LDDEEDECGGGIDEVVIVNAQEIEAPVSELVLESLFSPNGIGASHCASSG